MKEAFRYLQNAKEILKRAPIEDRRYVDVKFTQEACGAAYLAVLKVIDEYLLKGGASKKNFRNQWKLIEMHYENMQQFAMENS